MLKAMAVLRSVFLIFIVGFTLRGMPFFWGLAPSMAQQYERCTANLKIVQAGAWIAIAWIALETALGWLAARRPRREAPAAAPPAPHP
jgi:hypothetical protein